MKRLFTIAAVLFVILQGHANNVEISNVLKSGISVRFDVTWENSWRSNSTYHDAVWIFIKNAPNGGPSWNHSRINTIASVGSGYTTEIAPDESGFILRRSFNQHGTASTSVTAHLHFGDLEGVYQDVKVMAIEMVYIPTESFYLGDGASDRTFHKGDDPAVSYHVQSEDVMTHGTGPNDFDGGLIGADIPVSFPKGYSDFYCMKYQLTQGQYVDFLNCLPRAAQDLRTNTDLSGSSITNRYVMTNTSSMTYSNGIRCDADIGTGNITFYCDHDGDGIGNESNDGLSKVCGYLIIQDVYAYLDWAGLAPMTTLEYEKACRGPVAAAPLELAWGSSLINDTGSIQNDGSADETWTNSGVDGGLITLSSSAGTINKATRVGLNAPATGATRELSNASFYGLMDMTSRFDNLCMYYQSTAPYAGEEGDGTLAINGDADFMDIAIKFQVKKWSGTTSTTGDGGRVSSANGNTGAGARFSQNSFRGVKRL